VAAGDGAGHVVAADGRRGEAPSMSPGESGAMEKNRFLTMTTGPACQYKTRALILGGVERKFYSSYFAGRP
jgi:hypothetical protein